jgi:hypothetical protein
MKSNLIRLALLSALLLACAAPLEASEITVSEPDSPMLRFALGKLEAALRQQGGGLNRTSIVDYVKAGRAPEGIMSPIELAAELKQDCATATQPVAKLRARGEVSPTLDCELTDIEAWCAYGIYFAAKLRAGVALVTARANGDAQQQRAAVAEP